MVMSNNTKYIFLSPHLDDAIFSCGDYISKLTSEGEIVFELFTKQSDLIVANRWDRGLEAYKDKVYTRGIWIRD